MSEFWISKKKYFCKYCEIYIADDAPSRNHHESGMRHKGNLERFIRGIYKTGERRKKDLEEEKREMARIEQLAGAAFAEDVGAGRAAAVAGPSKPAPRRADKPSNPFDNYSTAQSLGYEDPDAGWLAKEEEDRRAQGVAGEWELVATIPPPLPVSESNGTDAATEDVKPDIASAGDKRPAGVAVEDEDSRSFKLRKKSLGVGLGEIYDPGEIKVEVRVKKEEEKDIVMPSGGPSAPAPIKWKSVRLTGSTPGDTSETVVKQEEYVPPAASSGLKWTSVSWGEVSASPVPLAESKPQVESEPQPVKQDTEASAPQASAPIFKKRKVPTSSARGRRPL